MASSAMGDDELRRKLIEYGEGLIPITDSTRPILLAKLQRLEEGNRSGSKPSPKRRSLLSFSSDESETDVNPSAILSSPSVNPGQRRSSRRSSKGGGGLPRSDSDGGGFVQARHPLRRSATASEILGVVGGGGGGVFKSPALPAPSKRQSHSPGSSSPAKNGTKGISQSRYRRSLGAGRGQSHSAPVSLDLDTSGSDSDISDSSISNIPENRGVDEFPRSRRGTVVTPTHSSSRSSPSTSARASLAASRSSNSLHGHSETSLSSSPELDGKGSSKQLNGSHKELSSAEGTTVATGADFEVTSNGGFVTDAPNNSQCVSMILLLILALFFVIVGVIYTGLLNKGFWPSFFALETVRSDVQPECKGSPTDICFEAAVQLKSLLWQLAGAVECGEVGDGKRDRRMTLSEAGTHLAAFGVERGTEVSLDDVWRIFTENPHWGIRLTGVENVAFLINPKKAWFESAIAEMSYVCRIRKALQNTIYKVSVGLACGIGIAGVLALLYWLWDRKRKERLETLALVEKILEVLQNHHCAYSTQASNLQPFVAIPHVRDMLIPPSDRALKRRAWEEAVRFIQQHESRVRFETQNVEGEDYVVWRWMQREGNSKYGGAGGSGGSKTSRIWQGQAFETLDTGMNSLPCSPTQCLKVRNMFDPDIECEDEWPSHIRDAILEKCRDADIVHLRVDSLSKEGCVYIKCRSSETAGRVYKDLHGWWFDGKLVTVKYLRLERYHERFPEASTCTKSLKPSGIAGSSFGIPSLSGMRLRSSLSVSPASSDNGT